MQETSLKKAQIATKKPTLPPGWAFPGYVNGSERSRKTIGLDVIGAGWAVGVKLEIETADLPVSAAVKHLTVGLLAFF